MTKKTYEITPATNYYKIGEMLTVHTKNLKKKKYSSGYLVVENSQPDLLALFNVFTNELEFDAWYVKYLTTTPEAFKEFIDLMRIVYNGESVYILCDWNNEISVNMIEALIKFIVDNYGYVSNVVKNYDDMMNLVEGSFSSDGIQLFDSNMETYINLFGINNLPSDSEG